MRTHHVIIILLIRPEAGFHSEDVRVRVKTVESQKAMREDARFTFYNLCSIDYTRGKYTYLSKIII